MKKNIKFKNTAFTLGEMMVVMLILSIALAASMPILTKRATSSKGELWRRVVNDVSRVYYGTSDGQHVQIGSKDVPQNGIASGSKLFINSANPLASPQLSFGVNGAYGGVIYVESPSKMNVRLANSSGNTFLLENADLQVEGNNIVNGSNTVSGNSSVGGTLNVANTTTLNGTTNVNNNLNIGSLGTNYSLLLNGRPIANGVPVGTIIIWAVSSAPNTGGVWLECNGQAFSASTYPELYAILGKTTVPNYSGMFLRGYGSQNSYHYGTVTHSSGGLGTMQGDAIRNITGWLAFHGSEGFNGGGAFTKKWDYTYHWTHHGELDRYSGAGYFDASLVVPTANENRPVNVAVKYFIKASN